jgi:parallel beta-helix repeat protein
MRWLLILVIFLSVGNAGATTRVVNTSTPACGVGEYYNSIQSAIDASFEGDEILVCPGTYNENVNIGIPLEVRSYSQKPEDTIIEAASPSYSTISITADNANVSGFAVMGATESGDAGVYLYANDCNISNNNFSNNYYGVLLKSSSNSIIENNIFSYNIESGIRLSSSQSNIISNNTVSNNWYGIYLRYSNSNTIVKNNISLNTDYGVYLDSSSDNAIYDNLFNNTETLYLFSSPNQWNTTKTSGINIIKGHYLGGNFWAKPDGTGFSENCNDSNMDGICDSTYALNSENTDHLPLTVGGIQNINTGKRFFTIQAAIDDAETTTGHTIIVPVGIFGENIDVTKSVNLVGMGPELTVVSASNPSDHTVHITTNNVNISGFTATGATDLDVAGVHLLNAEYCNISNSNISNNWYGLWLESSNHNTIENNTVSFNTVYGILSVYSSNNNILSNIISFNDDTGLYVFSSDNNSLQNNTVTDNNYGMYLQDSYYNTIKNNIANSNTYEGITLKGSNENKIVKNTANFNNYSGIQISLTSNSNIISDNNLFSNERYGIYFYGSSNNTITNNDIVSNTQYGIYIRIADNNVLYNNFFNNSANVYFYGTSSNNWNTTKHAGTNIIGGSYIGGNYWATPTGDGFSENCTDSDGDEICDSYYSLASDNIDYLPLFWEWTLPDIAFIYPTPQDNANFPASSVTFNVSVSDSKSAISACLLELNGANYSMEILGGGNSVTCEYADSFSDGFYTYRVYANDSYNNMKASETRGFLIDTVAPTISLSHPIDNYNSSSQIINFEFTTTDNIDLEISCTLYVDGTARWSNYSADFNTMLTLPEGLHSWYVNCTDRTNNTAQSEIRVLAVDLSPPLVEILSPINSSYASNTIDLNVTAAEPISLWMYSLNGGENTSFTPNTTASVPNGRNTLTVYAQDYAGNLNSTTVHFSVDTTPPNITIISPDNITYNSTSIVLDIITDENTNVSYSLNNASDISLFNSSTHGNTTIPAEEGPNRITISARDYLGNLNSAEVYFTVDTAPPDIIFVPPTDVDGLVFQDYSYINITISEKGTAWLEWNGTNETMNGSGTNWYLNKTNLEERVYSYTIYANDSVGNLNFSPLTIAVDLTPPQISFDSSTPPDGALLSDNSIVIGILVAEDNPYMATLHWNGINESKALSTPTTRFTKLEVEDGTYQYYIRATDAGGRSNITETRNLTVDTTPPQITLYSPENLAYASTTITINVSTNEPANVTYSINGANTSLYNSTTYGNKTINQTEGSHLITVYAVDSAGNTNSSTVYFTLDTTPPAITLASPQNTTYVTPSITLHVITNEDTDVIYSLNGASNRSLYNKSRADNVTLTAPEGPNDLAVYAYDVAGNMNFSKVSFFVDSLPPIIRLLPPTPPQNSNLSTAILTFNASISDAHSKVSYCLLEFDNINYTMDKSQINLTYCNITITVEEQGNHIYRIYANDTLGNMNASKAREFNIDTIRPTVILLSPQNQTYPNASVDLNISADEALSTLQYSLNGAINVSITSNTTITATEGINTIVVYAWDMVGNANSATLHFAVDTTPPDIHILMTNNSNLSSLTVNLSWEIQDFSSTHSRLYIDGELNETTENCSILKEFEEGSHNWSVEAVDNVGNQNSSNTYFFTVDVTKPLLKDAGISSEKALIQDGVEISVNATDSGTGVALVLAVVNTSNLTMGKQGKYSLKIFEEGSYNVTGFYAYDFSGNLNTLPSNLAFTLYNDTSSPLVMLHYPPPNSNISQDSFNLNWSASDLFPMTSTIYLDGNAVADVNTINGYNLLEIKSLPEGEHSWSAEVVDTANNSNITPPTPFTVDLTPPFLEEPSIYKNPTNVGEEVKISVKAQDGLSGVETVFVVIDGQNYSMEEEEGYYKLEHPFNEGSYNIIGFYAFDYAGNLESLPYNMSFKVVKQEPKVSIGGGGGGSGGRVDGGSQNGLTGGFNVLTQALMEKILNEFDMLSGKFYRAEPSLYPSLALSTWEKGMYPVPEDIDGLTSVVLDGDVYEMCAREVLKKWTTADIVLLARGDLAVDALSAIAYAKALGSPLLLTRPEEIPDEIYNAIEVLRPHKIIIIGGEKAVSEEVEGELAEITEVRRIGGVNREETAAMLAREVENITTVDTIVITDSENPGSETAILAYAFVAPVLYSNAEEIPSTTSEYLQVQNISMKNTRIFLVGMGSYGIHHLMYTQFPELLN